MHSPRIMRSLDVILGQAEAAVERRDWDSLADAARRVLAVDDKNEDALAFLSMALPGLNAPAPRATVPQPPAERAAPLLVAIEEELRAHPTDLDAGRGGGVLAPVAVAVAAPAAVQVATPVDLDRTVAPASARPFAGTLAEPTTVAAPEIASAPDAIAAPNTSTTRSRRRGIVVIGTIKSPRHFVPLSARGPLLLTAGILTATFVLTNIGAPRFQPTPLAARVVESATPAVPASAVEAPAPAVPAPVVEAPAPPVVEPALVAPTTTAPAEPVAIAPAVVAPLTVPPPVVVPAPRRYQGTFVGTMGRIAAVNGCEWDTPFEATVNATMTPAADGTMSGTATSLLQITYVVTNTPVGATCNPGLVSADANGTILGNGGQANASLAGPRELAISFVGTYADDAMVGTATLQRSLSTMSTFGATNVMKAAAPANLVLRRS